MHTHTWATQVVMMAQRDSMEPKKLSCRSVTVAIPTPASSTCASAAGRRQLGKLGLCCVCWMRCMNVSTRQWWKEGGELRWGQVSVRCVSVCVWLTPSDHLTGALNLRA